MILLTEDLTTQLAFAVYQNKGVFALLLGSGLSRAAQIPTGWEITLDLIRRIARAQGVDEQPDWAAWYHKKTGKSPDYSALLEELGGSPEERRAIIHGYIEPTDEDREEGRKVPTAAHRAIAELVRTGYTRVIVTTNFDRLMENALREVGIEPTIVASVDALSGAEPITHSACYILKLHGDYKDARILNIEAELNSYPPQYDTLLDRILDEHGLIICGWSGEWDRALRKAFLRSPNRRYSTFWAARGNLGGGAQDLVNHRGARVISITDADGFFSDLKQRVGIIEQTQRRNPQSVELLIESVKRFLAKPEHRIQLEELLTQETGRVLEQLESPDLAANTQLDNINFRRRVSRYEAIAEPLTCMVGILGRWGDGRDVQLLLDIIKALWAGASQVRAGMNEYLALRYYPAVLIATAYGLGLVRASRWAAFHQILSATINGSGDSSSRVAETLLPSTWDEAHETWKRRIDGYQNRKTPLSDYFFELFSKWGKRFMGLVPDFDIMFERFEMLSSLVYLERSSKEAMRQVLGGNPQQAYTWMPIGRAGYQRNKSDKLIAEIMAEPMKATLLGVGFAEGDSELLDLFAENYKRLAARMFW